MLQKVTVRARRSYNWICSDCRQRLGYSVSQIYAIRSFNYLESSKRSLSTKACASYTAARCRRPIAPAAVIPGPPIIYRRFYSSDGGPRDGKDFLDGVKDENIQPTKRSGSSTYAEDGSGEEFEEDLSDDVESNDLEGELLDDGYKPTDADMEEIIENLDKPEEWDKGEETIEPGILEEGEAIENEDNSEGPEGTNDISLRRVGSVGRGAITFWRPSIVHWLHQVPTKREKFLEQLERMNTNLDEGGYQLVTPNARWRHNRVVTRSLKLTQGYQVSIWQMFKMDFIKRYREGDPLVLLGRPSSWKPTVSELHKEYQKYFWEHKQKIKKAYALHQNWHNAPDIRKSFTNILFMLERSTDDKIVYRYKLPRPPGAQDAEAPEEDELLDEIVTDWRNDLEEHDPNNYKALENTEQERLQAMISLKCWRPPGTSGEIEEFRTEYMREVDLKNLGEAFGVKLGSFPLSSNELFALLSAISYEKISKQDIRYILPPEYPNSQEFFSHTIICLLLAHERYDVLNTKIMNVAINYMMRKNHIKRGRNLIEYMAYLRIPMNIGTFQHALIAAAKAKDIFVFERLLRRMMLKKLKFNREVWQSALACTHTPGQKLQIFETMVKVGIDPKRLAPGFLLRLAFEMYEDQLRTGNTNALVPWRHLKGIRLDPNTVNPILQFLYNHNAYDEARTFLFRVRKTGMSPNLGTLRIIVRENSKLRDLQTIVKAIHVFEYKYGITADGLIMEQIFKLAHRLRYYNVVRTVWAHACLTNQATKRIIDRMRHDIYETGRQAGKPGKLALGVCSEDSEAVVQTPVWAMRLISKARDPIGYLASEGEGYHNPAIMKDLNNVKERMEKIYEFRKRTVDMRKELMRLDLVAHHHHKPRRWFSVDLVAAIRRDLWLRKHHAESKGWSPLRWAWSMYQVRRVRKAVDTTKPLNVDVFERKPKMRNDDMLSEAKINALSYSILENMPTQLDGGVHKTLSDTNWSPYEDPSSEANPADTMDTEELTGKDLYAFYEEILNDDLESPEFADFDDVDDEAHTPDGEFLEHEASLALDDALRAWDEVPPANLTRDAPADENDQLTDPTEEVAKPYFDDGDEEYTESMGRQAAAIDADQEAQYAPAPAPPLPEEFEKGDMLRDYEELYKNTREK
ncbi:hypothetical protein H072_1327 [Dactylellina haptotyla CBS 200.50]|uniref:Uncharacterized protein n=1 Tax=Dactylellina haptotyla (strain CBS 200.50) TaxID=1284197 RepID=S8BYX2_DACHA|nr:hypothetical protein H072_1327 [Dactylellina haptotyla CBS 200.50]